ncbi:hypothetical protein BJ138DRAFT_971468, partial [Hygrophoropsis aurantiaca]
KTDNTSWVYYNIQKFLFEALCIVSVARPSLEHHWESKQDDILWKEHRDRIVMAINNGNVTAGLALTTSAVFLTTAPPLNSMVDYITQASYILLLGAFAHSLGSLLMGIAVVTIYNSCDRKWSRDVLMSNRFRVCSILLLIAFPTLSLGFSLLCLMSGRL